MGAVATSFGIAAAAVVALTLLGGRRHPAFRMAVILLAFWATANVLPAWFDPWMDACGFYAALLVWMDHRRAWPVVLGAAFLAQMVIHISLLPWPWYRQLALNLLFAVELAAVVFPVGVDALHHYFRRVRVPLGRSRSLGLLGRSPR